LITQEWYVGIPLQTPNGPEIIDLISNITNSVTTWGEGEDELIHQIVIDFSKDLENKTKQLIMHKVTKQFKILVIDWIFAWRLRISWRNENQGR
jgi:hypothetical protein